MPPVQRHSRSESKFPQGHPCRQQPHRTQDSREAGTSAIFQYERDDSYTNGKNHLPIVEMNVDLYIYTAPDMDSGITPISMLNPLIDAVDAALAPNPVTRRQTLGGVVSRVWIDGKIMKDLGDLDRDGIAVIPVKILATA
jgi:hypothetical protein